MLQARLSSTLAVAAKHELVVLMHGFSGHRVQMLPLASSLSREFKVLNYGYKSRSQKLQEVCIFILYLYPEHVLTFLVRFCSAFKIPGGCN